MTAECEIEEVVPTGSGEYGCVCLDSRRWEMLPPTPFGSGKVVAQWIYQIEHNEVRVERPSVQSSFDARYLGDILWEALFDDGVVPAGIAAVPHFLRIASSARLRVKTELLAFAGASYLYEPDPAVPVDMLETHRRLQATTKAALLQAFCEERISEEGAASLLSGLAGVARCEQLWWDFLCLGSREIPVSCPKCGLDVHLIAEADTVVVGRVLHAKSGCESIPTHEQVALPDSSQSWDGVTVSCHMASVWGPALCEGAGLCQLAQRLRRLLAGEVMCPACLLTFTPWRS